MKRSSFVLALFLVFVGATTLMAQPDLRIAPNYGTTPGSGFNFSPVPDGTTTPVPGSTMQVQFRVRNFGTTASNVAYGALRWNYTGTCSASDNQLGSFFSIPSLAPSALTTVYTRTITIPAGTGTRYICAQVDAMNSAGQTVAGRANDLFASPSFVVVAAIPPTVTPDNVVPTPSSVVAGGSLTLSYDLIAAGSPAPPSSGYVTIRLSGIGAACTGSDPALKNVTYSGVTIGTNPNTQSGIPLTISAGTTGSNTPRNICVWNGTTLYDSAPLTVTAPVVPSVVPANAAYNDGDGKVAQGGQLPVQFDIQVTNGPAPAGVATLRLNTSGTCATTDVQLGQVPYSGTNEVGKTATVTIPQSTPVGPGKKVCVWAGGTVYPTNVSATATFEVTSGAVDVYGANMKVFGPETTERPNDPSVPVPHIRPATVIAGDTISVTFDVYNRGVLNAGSAMAAIRFHQDPVASAPTPCSINDNLLGYVMVDPIPGNPSQMPWNESWVSVIKEGLPVPVGLAPNSVHKICVYLDDSNSAGQTAAGRADDLISEIIVHGALPDLVPVNIVIDYSDVTEATVTFNVYNQGRGASNATQVKAFLSDHDTLEAHTPGDNDTPLVISASDVVPALGSGAMTGTYTIAGIPIENLWMYVAEGAATNNGDGTFHMTAKTGEDYSAVSLIPGRYLWIMVDDTDVAGQVLPVLEANDNWSGLLNATPISVADLGSLKMMYTLNPGNQETAFDGSENNYPFGSTPYVGISVSGDYSDWIWAWFTAQGSNEPPSFAGGNNFELLDSAARFGTNMGPDFYGMTWNDVLTGGGPIGTSPQASKTISAISLIMYNGGADEDIDLTLQGISVGLN